jgi:thiamine monophosphate kinase
MNKNSQRWCIEMASQAKQQFYEIAVDESQPLEERYAAARELQRRTLSTRKSYELVLLWPHYTPSEIAAMLNVTVPTVIGVASQYGLWQRRRSS